MPVRKLEPGGVLIREWRGIKHRVAVGDSDFGLGGKYYRSLSEVARVITSSRWSGPLFFGLKNRRRAEASNAAR